jgi:hypothetical protein
MVQPRVVIQASREKTRLLVNWGNSELLRAALPPAAAAHSRAASTLLEGLALWVQQPLSVVLAADELESSCELGLCDGFGFGNETLYYSVEVLESGRRQGLGRFSDLRQLELRLRNHR